MINKKLGISFVEDQKELTLRIIGYEFEDIRGSDVYYSNWLMVKIIYFDENISFEEVSPCLLSDEVKDVYESIKRLVMGGESGLIKTFAEPYLRMSISKYDDDFVYQIRYVYDTSDYEWKEVCICQKMRKRDLEELGNIFKEIYDAFPHR